MLPFLALLGLTLLWLLLPLLPALRELARPTDVAPLKVVDRSSGYVAYFARNFRQYLDRQMAALPREAQAGDYVGKLPDGTQFVRVHKSPQGLTHELEAGTQNRLVVVDGSMTLQDDETFLMEVYARAPMIGGAELFLTQLRQPGELVKKDDIVAAFDTTEQTYKLREAEADLAEAEQTRQTAVAFAVDRIGEQARRIRQVEAAADQRL